jgi:hypothetical protein
MHESRGLEGVFPALAPHLPGCDAMQLAVYKFHELVGSSLIASTPFPEKAGYCVRIFRHIHRQSLRELFFAPAALIKWGEDLNVRATPFGQSYHT